MLGYRSTSYNNEEFIRIQPQHFETNGTNGTNGTP